MHLLRLLFTSLHFSDPSGSNLFFLSSLLLLHRLNKCAVTELFVVVAVVAVVVVVVAVVVIVVVVVVF